MKDNSVIFFTGRSLGGVGRVINILSKGFFEKGISVHLVENTTKKISRFNGISYELQYQETDFENKPGKEKILFIRVIKFLEKIFGNKDIFSILKFSINYRDNLRWLKKYLSSFKDTTVISFLNYSVFLSLLCRKQIDKLIISERNDPHQFADNKTTMAFIRKMYPKADIMVCQSLDAKKWYDKNSSIKSTVIFNPVKSDLPEPFDGIRQKKIVNFCRISDQKNLILLADAFALLSKDYPEYEMYVYGDSGGNGAEGYKEKVEKHINEKLLSDKMFILPGRADIHEHIKDYAMFVSSSDFEGMSNSMLEAMAMGMPCVCTDCPAGGARAVIRDHENGLLTPVGDAEALYLAMKEVIENPELAKKLGANATKIREEQSVEKITEKWMEIING